ncbi:annexin D2-like isoform X2 [Juglans microcarpa x Juglans regia]|uniref:annexin D2-like isoform X2 n=1 Tax=Juglans microcarpa x Juglans regia TaxID=2249226 RepID=UPI001B7D985E|nr:annexin D2-like isoform X2 [Juglans microcarpa x Juglans regia]
MAASSFQGNERYEFDCQILHHYLSGNGTINNQKLVDIFVHRSSFEFKLIRQTYAALYGQNVLHLFSNIQRNNPVARAAYLRMIEPQERDAEITRNSLFGGSVNLNTLIEIACTRPSSELQCIKQTYRSRYNSELEQDVTAKVRGGFKESCRNCGGRVDMSMAMCDAKTLYEAVESGRTVDQKTIISLLSQRNSGQVKAILVSYKQLYGHEFCKSLKQSKCGQFGREVRIVIRCIQNPEKFFAKQLRMKNADAREILIRIVITRSEIDIKDVNKAFAAKTGSSIEKLVRRDFNDNSKDHKTNNIVADILIGLTKRS